LATEVGAVPQELQRRGICLGRCGGIHGPFLFGATDKFEEIFSRIDELPPIVILPLRNMTAIDATDLQAFEKLADVVHSSGRGLILCGAREQPARLMKQAEFEQHVGSENICRSVEEALERAKAVHPAMALDDARPVVLEG
jgi:SulP family sulfate permease